MKRISGSIYPDEGKILYQLADMIEARHVLELGTFVGYSTNYLANAVRANWGLKGQVDTVDLVWYWGGVWRGRAIAPLNRLVVRQHKSDALSYLLRCRDKRFDMIFEDTSHTYPNTKAIIRAAKHKLRPGGILVIHDATSPVVGVAAAVADSGLLFATYHTECGLAVWHKPKEVAG